VTPIETLLTDRASAMAQHDGVAPSTVHFHGAANQLQAELLTARDRLISQPATAAEIVAIGYDPGSVAEVQPVQFVVGDMTMAEVFVPNGLTNLSDMQAVLDAVEHALVTRPAPAAVGYETGAGADDDIGVHEADALDQTATLEPSLPAEPEVELASAEPPDVQPAPAFEAGASAADEVES